LPDLTSKVVSLTLAGEEWARVLAHPRWEMQGGRLFLIGTIPPGGSTNDWLAGMMDAIAWEGVAAYIVFDSPEHYAKRLALQRRKKGKS
jgi:hypothetical protein